MTIDKLKCPSLDLCGEKKGYTKTQIQDDTYSQTTVHSNSKLLWPSPRFSTRLAAIGRVWYTVRDLQQPKKMNQHTGVQHTSKLEAKPY